MSSPRHLLRNTDPVDVALTFPGPESPLAFDDHVTEALLLASRPCNGRHARPRLPLLTHRERSAVAASSILCVVLLAALRW